MADVITPITEDPEVTGAVEATQAIPSAQGTSVGSETTAATGPLANTVSPLATDTAQLSETAQVVLLEQQGLTITEIADELGIPQTEVESDLESLAQLQQSATA